VEGRPGNGQIGILGPVELMGEESAVVSYGQALNFGQPVAIGLFAILHFLPDADDPAGTVACLRDAVAPGSYLAIARARLRDRPTTSRARHSGPRAQRRRVVSRSMCDSFSGFRTA
jgi:hypothetical protein